MAVDHHDGLPDIKRTQGTEHVLPLCDVRRSGLIRCFPGQATRGHQQIRSNILDADHSKAVALEDAADPR